METVFWILAVFLIILALVVFLPFSIRTKFSRLGENDDLIVEIQFWPRIRFRLVVTTLNLKRKFFRPILEMKTEMEDPGGDLLAKEKDRVPLPSPAELYRQFIFWLDVYNLLKPYLDNLKNKTELSRFVWKTGLGLGDPYYTGMAAGIVWSFKGFLAGYFCQLFPHGPARPHIEVIPSFKKKGFAVLVDCIFTTRIGHIIITGLRITTSLVITGKLKEIIREVARNKARGKGSGRTSH